MDSTILTQKQALRKHIKALKNQISFAEKCSLSNKLTLKLEDNIWFKQAKIIMAYWAMDDEVQTQDFIFRWYPEKQFVLPVVEGDVLKLKLFNGTEQLQLSSQFNVLEPTGTYFDKPELIDLIIVPGVAFDKKRNRMGRGKAYYDKLLINLDVKKIGICFDFQLLENIPCEETDVKMDCIITESQTI